MRLAHGVQSLRAMRSRDGREDEASSSDWPRAIDARRAMAFTTVACASCGRAVSWATILYTVDAVPVCPRCCLREEAAARGGGIARATVIGALACLAPFALPPAALACSALAILCGVVAGARARAHARWRWFAIDAAIVVGGAYHAFAATCG